MTRAQLCRADRRQAPHRRRRTRLFAMTFLATLVIAVIGASIAYAYMTLTDSSNAHAAQAVADSMPAGNTPSLSGSINGQNVTIAWSASTTVTRHAAVTSYTINRYSTATGGTPVAATGGCAGTVTSLTCTEQNVTPGTWFYAVTPHLNLWNGNEGPRSTAITVSAATFSITANQSLSAANLPTTVTGGTVAHFFNTESLTFHLDTVGGTALTTSPATVTTSSSGQASGITATIPGNTLAGTHTIWAVGNTSSLSVQSNSFTVTASATGLSPTTGTVATTGVTITAKGFIASHALTVTIGGNTATITSGGTTDANGNATVTFTIPAAPNGPEAVVLSDGTNTATSATNFTVTASASGLSPTTGGVGTTGVAITAQGFIASHALTVKVGGTSATITNGATSGTNGASTITFTVPAVANGSQPVVVSDGTNSATSGTNFTVNASATGLSPTSGTVGTTGVTINANGFLGSQALTVTVGGTSAPITAGGTTGTNGSSSVTFTIPAVPNGAQVVIVSDGTNSATSATNFTVNAKLTVSPTIGNVGDTGVTLTGSGYIATKTVNVSTGVTFGGSALTINATQTVAADGSWSATFTVPASSNGAQTITATDSGSASASATFTVNAKLTVSPTSGTVGTTGVTLTGSGYIATKTVNVSTGVTFGGSALTINATQTVAANGSWSATFTVPASSNGAKTITATDSGAASASATFTVNAKLTVSATSGSVGDTGVTLTGSGYVATKTVNVSTGVTFGGSALTINATQTVAANGAWSATFTVPNTSNGTKTIIATDSGAASASATFTVNAKLTVSPTSGNVGDTGVTLTGTGYNGGASVNVSAGVTFGGSALTISGTQTVAANGAWSATFTVPASSNGAQTITATDSGSASASATFTVNAKLTVAPTSGNVGDTGVTLTGSGYISGKTINSATGVTFAASALTINATQTVAANGSWSATFTVPASGNAAQTITATDSGSASASATFTVNAKLTVSPTSGTVGTPSVTLTGTGYTATKTVSATFGGSAVTLSPASPLVNATGGWTATFTVPAASNGAKTISATDSGGATASTSFTVNASASGLSPTSGPVGTTGVTINAQGFIATHALSVTVGGTATTISSGGTTDANGSATVVFNIPAVASGARAVVVSDATNSATSGTNFTVTAPTLTSINTTGTNPARVGPLTWLVTFNAPVSNVAASNFALVTTGITGTAPTIGSVTGPGPSATWTVSVNTTGAVGANGATIGLNLTSAGTIQDQGGNTLATTSFTGQPYTYDTTPPTVTASMSNGGGASKITVSGNAGTAVGDALTVSVAVCTSATYTAHSNTCAAGWAAFTASPSVTSGTYSASSGNIGSGTYFATATQSDAAGNVGSVTTGPFVR